MNGGGQQEGHVIKPLLSPEAADAVTVRVKALEAATGVEVVCAAQAKSDAYPEIPWKAFALTSAIAALVVVLTDALHPQWVSATSLLVATLFVLGAGIAAALACSVSATVARGFVGVARMELEARERAKSLFLDHRVFATGTRTGVLLYVTRFERRVEILPDVGFEGRVSSDEWSAVIATMQPGLRDGDVAGALRAGLDALQALLAGKGFVAAPDRHNELDDPPLQERAP